ncbi:MAG TPA: CU044_5270 family protein, partial [Rugosimonospora sp.]|nr:CU044_5270 family protein [Rugosimonospora sp.]
VGVLLAAGFIGYQVASPHGGAPTSAASVLRRAADAAEPAVALHPRPGQYVYREVDHVTGALRSRVRSWQSADGSQPGLVTVTGDTGDSSSVTPPYRAGDSLSGAPYSVLGALPTDPDALRRVLEADPMVHTLVTASAGPGQTAAVWNLMRDLVWTVPPRQQAALFRMAAMLPGITVEGSVVDAAGRGGIAVGLFDPALGRIEFVFDPGDYRFLGERIVDNNRPGRVLFNDTLRRTTVVDRSGQTPQ